MANDNSAGLLFGTISEVDAQNCRIRVSLPDRDGVNTFWLHVPQKNTQLNKHRSLPDIGAQAAVMIAENGVDGLYIGSIYSSASQPPITDSDTEYVEFGDGSTISYNRSSNKMVVKCVGDVYIEAAKTLNIVAGTSVTIDAPEITITGNTTIQKMLTVNGGLNVRGGSSANSASITGNMSIDGTITHKGDVEQTGDVKQTGDLVVSGTIEGKINNI